MSIGVANGYYAPTAAAVPQPPAVPTAPTPVTVNVGAQPGVGAPSFGSDQFSSYANTAAQYAVQAAPYAPAAFAGKAIAGAMGEARSSFARAASTTRAATKAKAMTAGRSAAFGGIMGAVKSSVLFNGLFSLALNGYKTFTKQQTVADGAANVTGDLASAAVGGAAGAMATAAGTALLGTMGLAGAPLAIGTFLVGAAGYFVADALFRKTAVFQSLTAGVKNLLAGH